MKNGRAASLLASNLKYTSRKNSKRRKSKSPKIDFKVEKVQISQIILTGI